MLHMLAAAVKPAGEFFFFPVSITEECRESLQSVGDARLRPRSSSLLFILTAASRQLSVAACFCCYCCFFKDGRVRCEREKIERTAREREGEKQSTE